MKAVILCAGKSTRTYPLTVNKPKTLLRVMNKTLLEHNLEQLDGLVNEVMVVVGFKKEMIIKKIGNKFNGLKIKYVIQKELNGPGGAIQLCKRFLKDKFVVLNGDDIYSRKDIKLCLKHRYCVMFQKVDNPKIWGILEVKNKKVVSFEEKPKKPKSNIANIGLYVFDKKIFEHKLKKTKRNEYEITDYITYLVKKGEDVYCEKVKDYWLPVGYPWHLFNANEFFLKKIKKNEIKGKVHKNVHIEGKVILGKGSEILPGTHIEGNMIIGENCKIGPNTYFRGYCSIGDNCRIGSAEVKNSIFFDGVRCDHTSYIGDSILGEKAHIGAGTVTANLRHDKANIKSMVKGNLEETGRRKLGLIMGDNADTGINTSVYPGRKIWPGKATLPGEVVKRDIE